MTLDGAWALRWMQLAAESVRARSSELTEMDAVIGDGDHGTNLDRGMQAVLEALDGLRRAHPEAAPMIGQVLHTVATSLTTTVGGAAGPLLGAAFLKASRAVGDEPLDACRIAALMERASEGIASRGRADAGDKTMLDVWVQAAQAARREADGGAGPQEVLRAASLAAAHAAESIEALPARKGRASYRGDCARGHRDPGAQSSALLIDAAARAL